MNIAIVDDERIELETTEIFLRVYIKKFWTDYESQIHIETFRCAGDFLTFFSPKIYRLVILGGNMRHIVKFICAHDVKILLLTSEGDL